MLPFWISIGALSLVQGALVAVPGTGGLGALRRLRGRRWAVIPPLSVIGFVFVARGAEQASAQGLTYLALVAVPLLAALALGWLAWNAHPPRPARALLVAPLFALAWADRDGLAGEAAALVLSALSCVSLGVLLAAVTPPRWLAAGIVAMAVADTTLVVSDLLAATEQRAERRAPGGRIAAAAERRVRHGGDRLRRPVRRGSARCAARGCPGALVADAWRGARGIAGGGFRPAVLLRR